MVVGELAESVDLLVVGAGPGGYVAAVRAAEMGRSVTVVDRDGPDGGLGGACLHVGCIPSKALIELANAYERSEQFAVAGLRVDGARIDLHAFQAWKDSIVSRLAGDVESILGKHEVRVVAGSLRFNKPNRAAVVLSDGQNRYYEFEHAVIATGSRPGSLPSLRPDGERVLTSAHALALDRLPKSLVVVGAGYIGLEIGQAFAKLGTDVSVVEATDRILPTIDESLTKPVLRSLGRLGVELYLSSHVVGLNGDTLVYEGPEGSATVPAEKVLVAVGRVPNTDQLGLTAAHVPVDADGLIPVDQRMMATPSIAAIGDVTAGPALAHKASAQAIVAAEALSGAQAAFDPAGIPAVFFTDPEVASIGLTEQEAKDGGFDVGVATAPLSASGRAATLGSPDGFTRIVLDRSTDRVLGAQMVGPHASELVAEAALAIEMVASPEDLRGTIHPHPTLSEGLQAAAAQPAARPRCAQRAAV